MPKPTITICASSSFYEQLTEVQAELEKLGHKVLIPASAKKMQASGNYDADQYKTWVDDAANYDQKAFLMREHFAEIEKGDAMLVLNYEKHGTKNYIGGNVLIEMAIAFWLEKPIYILNGVDESSPYLEEVLGMQPILLHGDLRKIES